MKRFAGLLTLLVALLLPLQGFARVVACDAPAGTAAPSHCAGEPHGAPAHAGHDCGTCCLALTPAPALTLPGSAPSAAQPVSRPVTSHPALLPDRLDRPPRV